MIPVFRPSVCPGVGQAVAETIQAGFLSEGDAVRGFEEVLKKRFRFPNAVAVNSGTAALHLALDYCAVEGREVITTAQSFEATAMSIRLAGATPVFADIEMTGCIDPTSIEDKLTEQTTAVLVVHYGGMPCDLKGIFEVTDADIAIIEDCAHALGATYLGNPVGTMGAFGCFSFQAIKQLTTGDGGLVVASSQEESDWVRRARWFGIDREKRSPITHAGWKYHMNDIAATMGLVQLECFDERETRRRAIAETYLSNISPEILPPRLPDRQSTYWLFTLLVERRDDFIRAMRDRGVESGAWHRRIDRHPYFGGVQDLPNQALFDTKQVIIPCRPNLTDEDVETVVEAVKEGW